MKKNNVSFQVLSFILLLFCISSLSRLATSIYLPALPSIGDDLNIEKTMLSLTLSCYFGGFAASTLIVGPLSDAFGRRKIILGGSLVFLAGTLVCSFSQGGISLLLGRILQAMGACSIPVTCRAVVRDYFDDQQVVTIIGWLGVLGAMIPALAPTIGGVITEHLGWRYIFYTLAIITLFIFFVELKTFPETLVPEKRQPLSLPILLKRYAEMLSCKPFLLVILPVIFSFGMQGVYFTCSPFAFIDQLHLTPTQFGLTNICLVASLMVGRIVCPMLVKKLGLRRTYCVSGIMMLGVGCSFIALCFITKPVLYELLIPATFFGLSFGIMVPLGVKEALTLFAHQAGSASALYGCVTLGASGVFSVIAGLVMDQGISAIHAMSVISAACSLLIFITALLFYFYKEEPTAQKS